MRIAAWLAATGIALSSTFSRPVRATEAPVPGPPCPRGASYCSARTLFLPPIDGSGTALVGGSAAGDGNVLVMGGSASWLPGSRQGPFDLGLAFQHRSGITVGIGAPFAILPADTGAPSGVPSGGNRTTVALAADLKVPVIRPTAGQFGGFAAHALLRAQTPGLTSDEPEGDSSAFELRALLSFRAFIFALQPTVGFLWQPDRPGYTWSIPFGAALNVHFAPPSWNDDARPRLFFEWLSYGGERWSHGGLAGLAFHFRNGSFAFGLGGASHEGNDSFLVRFSWTARTRIGDADGDGVADDVDQCPHLREDRDGDRDADGCPEDDTSRSGVPDTAGVCAESGSPAPSATATLTLVLDASGFSAASTKLLLARLAPEICHPSFRGFVSSENGAAAAAARKAVEDFTGRANAFTIVAPPAWSALTDAMSKAPVLARDPAPADTASPDNPAAEAADTASPDSPPPDAPDTVATPRPAVSRAVELTGQDGAGRPFVIRIRTLVDPPGGP